MSIELANYNADTGEYCIKSKINGSVICQGKVGSCPEFHELDLAIHRIEENLIDYFMCKFKQQLSYEIDKVIDSAFDL